MPSDGSKAQIVQLSAQSPFKHSVPREESQKDRHADRPLSPSQPIWYTCTAHLAEPILKHVENFHRRRQTAGHSCGPLALFRWYRSRGGSLHSESVQFPSLSGHQIGELTKMQSLRALRKTRLLPFSAY